MDSSPLGSSVHEVLQTRVLECVAMLFSKIFLTQGSNSDLHIASRLFTMWAPREAPLHLRFNKGMILNLSYAHSQPGSHYLYIFYLLVLSFYLFIQSIIKL